MIAHLYSRKGFERFSRALASRRCACLQRSPNLNAYAERFVGTINESCLDPMILIGEASLYRVASPFVLHYHAERHHQGLENKIIRPEFPVLPDEGEVVCRKRLGRLPRH